MPSLSQAMLVLTSSQPRPAHSSGTTTQFLDALRVHVHFPMLMTPRGVKSVGYAGPKISARI